MSLGVSDRVVVVTGAGKGIGYETAKIFYKNGARLAVISRDESDLIKLKKELNSSDLRFFYMAGDVSDEKVVTQFIGEVFLKYKRIDCLINNAGMRFRKKFLDISSKEIQNVLDVNVGSCFLMTKAVLPFMVDQSYGRIINMASIVGTLGLPELSVYAASKGAIISLTKSLALEFAEYNINVNAIAPGFCKTSYADKFMETQHLYDFTIERTPVKRWGESSDIANACLYLASNMSNYVTGETLNVDGGWSAW